MESQTARIVAGWKDQIDGVGKKREAEREGLGGRSIYTPRQHEADVVTYS
jgi:hypothetical protein